MDENIDLEKRIAEIIFSMIPENDRRALRNNPELLTK